jgi:hypothetical protein
MLNAETNYWEVCSFVLTFEYILHWHQWCHAIGAANSINVATWIIHLDPYRRYLHYVKNYKELGTILLYLYTAKIWPNNRRLASAQNNTLSQSNATNEIPAITHCRSQPAPRHCGSAQCPWRKAP